MKNQMRKRERNYKVGQGGNTKVYGSTEELCRVEEAKGQELGTVEDK